VPIEEKNMAIEKITYDSPVEALEALVRSLVGYEQRYRMSSAEFFAQYQEGKLGDSADFVEWAGDYQQYLGVLQTLHDRLRAAV
jgi:hypothetical protein